VNSVLIKVMRNKVPKFCKAHMSVSRYEGSKLTAAVCQGCRGVSDDDNRELLVASTNSTAVYS